MRIKNVTLVLTGLSIVGTVITAIAASRATLAAKKDVSFEQSRRFDRGKDPKLNPVEYAKVTWKYYIPTMAIGTATIGCTIASHRLSYKHILALSSASVLSGRLLDEYKDKAINIVGKDKYEKIKKAIWQESKASPKYADEGNDPQVYFYEEFNDRYFKSSLVAVQAAEMALNRAYVEHNDATLGQFYDILGIADPTGIADRVGWAHEIQGKTWIDITHTKMDEFLDPRTDEAMNEDCYILEYVIAPEPLDRLE